MNWYTGDIAGAITLSKSKGAIFVVYIEGEDDKSKAITELFDKGILGERVNNEHFVAIKIQAGSVPHQQFSEFYKGPSVPSVYFIGKQGSPLDIIKGTDELGDLSPRIDSILSKGGIVIKSLLEETNESEREIVCENGVCKVVNKDETKPVASTSTNNQESVELTTDEKVVRAKDLIEEKRKQKEMEEKENERLKELERRKMGQSVQELKRWQKDQELKQLIEDREKEKREEKLAKERVLAQIKQDREERLSKTQPPVDQNSPKSVSTPPSQVKSDKARLQFKLPDGSSNTQEFSISDTLQFVVDYIKENLTLPSPKFKLSTTFPRREFSNSDYSQTLVDLQLTPNAVILILPETNATLVSSSVGGTLTSLLWSLFSPVFGILNYLKGLVFGRNENTTGSKRSSDDMAESRSSNPKRRVMRDSTVVKRQGNVHRLTDRNDSDDEGNTWNGNSTQQM